MNTATLKQNLAELDAKINSAMDRNDVRTAELLKAEHERLYRTWLKSLAV